MSNHERGSDAEQYWENLETSLYAAVETAPENVTGRNAGRTPASINCEQPEEMPCGFEISNCTGSLPALT